MRGVIHVDWVIAIGVFLVFIIWAFAFYGQIFTAEGESIDIALEKISDTLMDNLTVKVHSLPITVNISNASVSNNVIYFEYTWPFGKNSTQILNASGSNQSCNITGNTIYWRSNLAANANYFSMKYADRNTTLGCTGGFAVVNETQAIPFAREEQEHLSQTFLDGMAATPYNEFRSQLGITRDFNITVENDTAMLFTYGIPLPKASDVYAKKILRKIEESDRNVTIRIFTW